MNYDQIRRVTCHYLMSSEIWCLLQFLLHLYQFLRQLSFYLSKLPSYCGSLNKVNVSFIPHGDLNAL